MKKRILIFLSIILCSNIFAQGTSFSFSSDFVTRYIWRGSEFGKFNGNYSTPHIQPTAALTYTTESSLAYSIGFWGSYGFNGDYSESDLYINFYAPTEAGDFSFTFSDYYYPFYGIPFTNFDGDGLGAHTIEANFAYSFKNFPLRFMVSNNIHNDVPDNKSLYFELGYGLNVGEVKLDLFLGAAQGPSIWHAVTTDKFEFINTGFTAKKEIKVSESLTIPAAISWIYNAHTKTTYLVGKITI